jgi:thiol-disulfide isomerase/thioredoxin
MKAFKILYVIPILAVLSYAASDYITNNSRTVLPYDYSPEKYRAALESGKPVVLEIGASWCKACIEQQPIMEELKKEYKEVKFFLANYDKEKELVKKHGVIGLPTFILIDSRGREVMSIAGFQEKQTLESLILRLLYGNYALSGSYSTFDALKEPEVRLENGRVVIETEALENFTVWGESAEVFLNNISLEVLKVSPEINSIRDFETMDIAPGTLIKAEAKLPADIAAYETLNAELKLGIWDPSCCGEYREVLLGGNFTR